MAIVEKISDIKSIKKVNVVGKTVLDHYHVTDQNDKILSIPIDPLNRHYLLILEWVDAGNTIAEAD
tara:strand:- start:24 stop:221 length:198 start_codon:yes stop_codon:yes gene_type:complete